MRKMSVRKKKRATLARLGSSHRSIPPRSLLGQKLVRGDTWYLVEVRWIKQWKKYTAFDQPSGGEPACSPGPIETKNLFSQGKELKEHLMEELEYTLVPEETWELLVERYGLSDGSQPIPRKVVEYGLYMKHCKVEVYLLNFKLCLHPNLTEHICREFSRANTVADLEAELRRTFTIPDEIPCRVWHRSMSHNYELLPDPSQTLQDAGLYNMQTIIIEMQNCDGTWPRDKPYMPVEMMASDTSTQTANKHGVTAGQRSLTPAEEACSDLAEDSLVKTKKTISVEDTTRKPFLVKKRVEDKDSRQLPLEGAEVPGDAAQTTEVPRDDWLTVKTAGVPRDDRLTVKTAGAPRDDRLTVKTAGAPRDDRLTVKTAGAPRDDWLTVKTAGVPRDDQLTVKTAGAPRDDRLTVKTAGVPRDDWLTVKTAGAPRDDWLTVKTAGAPRDDRLTVKTAGAPRDDRLTVKTAGVPRDDRLTVKTAGVPRDDRLTVKTAEVPADDWLTAQQKSQYDELEQSVAAEQKRANQASQRAQDALNRLAQRESQLKSLNTTFEEKASQLQHTEDLLREQREKRSEEEKRASEAEKRLEHLLSELQQLTESLHTTQQERDAAREKASQVELERNLALERASQAEASIKQRDVQIHELEERQKLAEDRIGTLETELRDSQQRLQETEQRLQQAYQRGDQEQQRAANAETRLQHSDQMFQDIFQRLIGQLPQSQPPWVIERNEIELTEEELGSGGWATVKVGMFRGNRVAAKCLHRQIVSAHNVRLFTREMNMAANARHPNLLQFIGATLDNQEPIILTELMPTSLCQVMERGTRLSHAQITSVACQVALALNYLHLTQPEAIIHRDVSSSNVLLDLLQPRWKVKLSDYGSANFVHHTITTGPGNPTYAAPEAHNPEQHSTKMDVFSFGVLLVEMCAGELAPKEHRDRLLADIRWPAMVAQIRLCLMHEPQRRPDMAALITQLNQL